MSLNEVLATIPKLSFAERQQVIRRAIEEEENLTPEEAAIIDERLRSFQAGSRDGVAAESLRREVLQRLTSQ